MTFLRVFRQLARPLAGVLLLPLALVRAPVPALAEAASENAAAQTERVLELTNAERVRAGLPPLALSPQLTQAAQQYSDVLATDGCFAHTCGPVPEMTQRDAQAGYTGWTAVGENIAAGYPSPEAVVSGWMASPGHRANILNPDYRELGVGLSSGGKYGAYWTEEFGARPAAVADTEAEDN